MRRTKSFKGILMYFWIIVCAVIILLYVFTQAYILNRVTRNVESSIQGNIYSCENGIEDTLGMIDEYIYESFYNTSSISIARICQTLKQSDDIYERQNAQDLLCRMIQGIDLWSDKVAFAMLYVDLGEEGTWFESGTSDNYQIRRGIKEMLERDIKDGVLDEVRRYLVFEQGNRKQILRFMKLDNCYFVMGVSQDAIIEILEKGNYSSDGIVLATDENGDIIFASQTMDVDSISFENEGRYVKVNGSKYLQTGHISNQTGYYFGIMTDKKSIQSELASIRVVFAVVLLLLIMLIRISFEYSRKYIEEPLVRIASAMKAVEEGELDTHVSSMSQILEFNQLENSFNHMIERIQQLKIEKYETELTAQKASMQYLQVQIKPHFYANMLNIIYSLAETKDYATIQKISRAIVEFSRYMFRDATQMVELKRELEYVNCYMDIQEIRYQKQITLETEIMENLDEALVPPFVIQGFVENSVKYAFSTRKNCLIKVSISLDDERENIHICIRDNGIGYPETMLGEGWHDISYQMEEHIGFENLYKRMELIYGQNAKIWLANEEGAVTYINIPYIAIDNMAEDDL